MQFLRVPGKRAEPDSDGKRKKDSSSAGSGVRITESPDSARRTAPSSENHNKVSALRPTANNQTI